MTSNHQEVNSVFFFSIKKGYIRREYNMISATFLVQWGGGITGHLLFTPVMTHKSEVYRLFHFG